MNVFAVLETEYGTSHWNLYGLFETRKAADEYAVVLREDESDGGYHHRDPFVRELPVHKVLDHPVNPGFCFPRDVNDPR